MPGRLMVGRVALDHVVKVRVLPGQFFNFSLRFGQVGLINQVSLRRVACVFLLGRFCVLLQATSLDLTKNS